MKEEAKRWMNKAEDDLRKGKDEIKTDVNVTCSFVTGLLGECEILNPVYIETRYPDISKERYTSKESEKDIKIARKY